MKVMTLDEKVRAIENWQKSGRVHPLTCSGGGGPGDHQADLVAMVKANPVTGGSNIVLNCPDCGFVQHDVPPVVYEVQEWMDSQPEQAEEMRSIAMMRFFMGG